MTDKDIDTLSKRVVAFCNIQGYYLAPEAEKILLDIVHLKKTYGDYYCPFEITET
jgi:ferredoxin-thioredoxin reductase catalytic subunit